MADAFPKSLKILHTADLHLGSVGRALPAELAAQLQEAQERLLSRISQLAVTEEVDLLILAGDVFDHTQAELRWVKLLRQACEQMPGVDVLITPGNHDPYYEQSTWTQTKWPENVHIIRRGGGGVFLPEKSLAIDAVSFTGLLQTEPLPLEKAFGLAEGQDDVFRLLVMHGELLSPGQNSLYHPIRAEDWPADYYDYVALGHIHKKMTASWGRSLLRYPGFPQGRGFDECGVGTIWLGSLTMEAAFHVRQDWRECPLSSLFFARLTIEVEAADSDLSVLAQSRKALQQEMIRLGAERHQICWRIEYHGRREADYEMNLETIKGHLLADGYPYIRAYDHSFPAVRLEHLEDDPGFGGYLYRAYVHKKQQNRADGQDDPGVLLQQSLEMALHVIDHPLSENDLRRLLPLSMEYLQEDSAL